MTHFPIASATIALLLASCASMNVFSGLGVVSSEKSGFDGRDQVQVTGNYVMPSPGSSDAFGNILLGARWESSDPDNVALTLSALSGYDASQLLIAVDSFSVNLDGQITRLTITDKGLVKMPLSSLGKMLDAKTCRLQVVRGINTSEGDFTIASNGGAPTAKASFKQFYDKVLATKALGTSK